MFKYNFCEVSISLLNYIGIGVVKCISVSMCLVKYNCKFSDV